MQIETKKINELISAPYNSRKIAKKEIDEIDTGYFRDARERTYNLYRLKEYDKTRVAGYYQFPTIKACHYVPDKLIPFNYVRSYKGN